MTPKEVAQMLGFSRTGFAIFLAANPLFPCIKAVGKTKGGGDLKRYIRTEVEAYKTLFVRKPED
jgi:hypothetical protein